MTDFLLLTSLKIGGFTQIFIDNIQKYLLINIDSIYFSIEDTIKSQDYMLVDLKRQLVNCFTTILEGFFQTRDWQTFYTQLKKTIYHYQQNHPAVECLAISFFRILGDIDFFQYFIVMEQDVTLQEKQYQHYLDLLDFIYPLMTVYKLTEYLEKEIDIEGAGREFLKTLLLLFQTFSLTNQLEENIDTSKLFEELHEKNQSDINDIFEKVRICLTLEETQKNIFETGRVYLTLEEMQDKLLELLTKYYNQIENLWQTFQNNYENCQAKLQLNYFRPPNPGGC